jgi:hypothetical protein
MSYQSARSSNAIAFPCIEVESRAHFLRVHSKGHRKVGASNRKIKLLQRSKRVGGLIQLTEASFSKNTMLHCKFCGARSLDALIKLDLAPRRAKFIK